MKIGQDFWDILYLDSDNQYFMVECGTESVHSIRVRIRFFYEGIPDLDLRFPFEKKYNLNFFIIILLINVHILDPVNLYLDPTLLYIITRGQLIQ